MMTTKSYSFKKLSLIMFFFACLSIVVGCTQQGRGFALPEGDIAVGKTTFSKLGCNDCHNIADIKWKGNPENPLVPLGGSVHQIKSYGELVTSVINPSHKIAKGLPQVRTNEDGSSKMRIYNEVMTVQELVDIVSFLKSEYKIEIPSDYYYYQ